MGFLGSQIGGALGGLAGGAIGQKVGGSQGQQAGTQIGTTVGQVGGGFFPYFAKGGPVKKTGLAYVHKGEYVLPKGVKPSIAQKAKVAKGKKRK